VTTYGRIAHAAGGGAIASQSITSIFAKATTTAVRSITYHRSSTRTEECEWIPRIAGSD